MAVILVVEDNPLNLELVTDLLEAQGHDVRPAGTAEDGVRLAKEIMPDLILMDVRLPGMDGHTAARLLKGDAVTSGIPTVALTAQAMKGDMAVAIAAGFDGYIPKPIDIHVFSREIGRLLGSKGPVS